MFLNSLLTASVFLFLTGMKAPSHCLLPTSGADKNASPPALAGTIVTSNQREKSLTVTVKSGIKSSNILVRDIPEDQIFTQYGGTAKFEDLIEGDEVRIWSKDCRPAKKSALKAAAMIVFK